jgi:hypothetical protein
MVSTPSASMHFSRISAPDSFTTLIPVIPSQILPFAGKLELSAINILLAGLCYKKMAGVRPAIRPFEINKKILLF